MTSRPCLLQLEKVFVQQRRPSTAKKQRKKERKRMAQSCEQKELVTGSGEKPASCHRCASGAGMWPWVPSRLSDGHLFSGSWCQSLCYAPGTRKRGSHSSCSMKSTGRCEWANKYKPTAMHGDWWCVSAAHVQSEESRDESSGPVYSAFAVDWALSYANQINSRQQPFREGEERGLRC